MHLQLPVTPQRLRDTQHGLAQGLVYVVLASTLQPPINADRPHLSPAVANGAGGSERPWGEVTGPDEDGAQRVSAHRSPV